MCIIPAVGLYKVHPHLNIVTKLVFEGVHELVIVAELLHVLEVLVAAGRGEHPLELHSLDIGGNQIFAQRSRG